MNPVALPLNYNLVQLLELRACVFLHCCSSSLHFTKLVCLFVLFRCQRWEVYSSAAGGSTGVSCVHRHVRGKYQPEPARVCNYIPI